jgi:hypothetical protein
MPDTPLVIDQTCQRCGRKSQVVATGYAEPWTGRLLCPACVDEMTAHRDTWPKIKVGPTEIKLSHFGGNNGT